MDTYSRVATFAMLFNHYRDMGMGYEAAREAAKKGTDANMGAYGSADSAAMFSHAGGVGGLTKPLQTLPTTMGGNLVADLARIARNPTKLKAYAPFLTYALTTMLIGGLMGAQGQYEYEAIRKMLENAGLPAPPSLVDVIGANPELLNNPDTEGFQPDRALLLGLLPEIFGVDVASSLRANKTFEATILSIIAGQEAWSDATPTVTFPVEYLGGVAKLGYQGISKATGGTGLDDAGLSKAIGAVAPSGPIGYGLKELAGVNETNVFGDNTGMMPGGTTAEATTPRGLKDIVAGTAGTKATEDRANLLTGMREVELDKIRQNQIKSATRKFVETGNPIHLHKLEDLEAGSDEISNLVGTQVYKKLIAAKTRYYSNKQGTINENKAKRAMEYDNL
jgi:hypothetical protein